MTLDEFENAILQTPSDLNACHEESGNYFADIECEDELFCIVYAGGNWTLGFEQSTQTIAIDESDLPNLKTKIQELKEKYR